MLLQVEGLAAYCYTGGAPWAAPARPCAVFIHGAQNDHSVWLLQTRYFAHHGFDVLAPDLPGHGRSQGAPKTSIGALAEWLLALLDAAGVAAPMLIGHSMGALIALECARLAPGRVRRLALLGAAWPMQVSDALLEAARHDEQRAFALVTRWSHASLTQKSTFPGPGSYGPGGALRLKQRIAQRNPAAVCHCDFSACNAYAHGAAAARAVRCPTLFILGTRDSMTPLKATRQLTSAIGHGQVMQVDSGHELMAEQPDAVLDALFRFANRA